MGDGSDDSNDEEGDDDELDDYDDHGDGDGDSGSVVDEENLPWISAVHDWSNCVLVPAQPLVYCTLLKHEYDDNS